MRIKPYYQDDSGILYCGDCLDILPQLEDKSVDLVLTDPPYEIKKADWDIRPEGWLDQIKRLANGAIYWFGMPQDIPQQNFRTLIYAKTIPLPRHPMNNQNDWTYSYQPIFYQKGKIWNKPSDGKKSDVLFFHPEVGIEIWYHPTQKPIKLIKKIIEVSSNEFDLILDPFLGSGTTAVACKMLNRRWIGIEINPKYCDIAIQRLKAIPENLFKDVK